MGPKKIALWFLINSVALSAVLGIIAILSGSFGRFEIRVVTWKSAMTHSYAVRLQ